MCFYQRMSRRGYWRQDALGLAPMLRSHSVPRKHSRASRARLNSRACSMKWAFPSRSGGWPSAPKRSPTGPHPSTSRPRSVRRGEASVESRTRPTQRKRSSRFSLSRTAILSWSSPPLTGDTRRSRRCSTVGVLSRRTRALKRLGASVRAPAGGVGVDHPFARHDVAILGERLGWHAGLTLDYVFRGRDHVYIECNPRTVEPANAAASGVNLPELQLALSLGDKVEGLRVGRPGIRTHSSLAILLGIAAYVGTRKAVLIEALRLIAHRGPYEGSRECLTPVLYDPLSAIPLAMVAGHVLLFPHSAEQLAGGAVRAYSITPDAIEHVASGTSQARRTQHRRG